MTLLTFIINGRFEYYSKYEFPLRVVTFAATFMSSAKVHITVATSILPSVDQQPS